MLECVINVSEGRDDALLAALAEAAGRCLLDVHRDGHHHRSVFTLAGADGDVIWAAQNLTRAALERIDLAQHQGVHPRIGVVDVVPWVALDGWPVHDGPMEWAIEARDRFAEWAGRELGLPCFLYGPERSLPEIRRQAWHGLDPTSGPGRPHPTGGAAAVGARNVLVAYNLWLGPAADSDRTGPHLFGDPEVLPKAKRIASAVRGPELRALGLPVGERVQVSCNLIAPWVLRPDVVFDLVAARAEQAGLAVTGAELVGLLPQTILTAIPPHRWPELDLGEDRTIEARLEEAGLDGGRSPAPNS